MINPEEKSRIDELGKNLYSRNAPDIKAKRRLRFHDVETNVNQDWEHEQEVPEQVALNQQYKESRMSFTTKMLIGSVAFFFVAMAIGALLFLRGGNIVSANNVDITIEGPVSVAGGEPFSFDINVQNKNNVRLEVVDVSVEFPSGSINPKNTAQEQKTFRELAPNIEPGRSEKKTIEALLYGEAGTKKEIKVKVQYKVPSSNAVLYKERIYEVFLASSPVTMNVTSFKEANSNQEIEFTVVLQSNSNQVLKNLMLKAQYPFGFTFTSSDIKPQNDNMTWKLGDIPPGGKQTIKLRGKIQGQDEEERAFKFILGVASEKNPRVLAAEFISNQSIVKIKKPFLSVQLALNDVVQNTDHTANFNQSIRGEVTWFNNLATAVIDGEIRIKFSGNAFDKVSVNPNEGFYDSANNEIIWSKQTTGGLGSIGASEGGRVSFSFVPRDLSAQRNQPVTNPQVNIQVSAKANRVSESQVPEIIASSQEKVIKIASNIGISSQVLRTTGPFQNTGPIPPKAEQMTTYTVIWTILNTSNNISDGIVTSSLPPYVKWLGKIDPTDEDVTFNPVDNTIKWKLGPVSTYAGQNSNTKQLAFQVGFTPSVNQVSQVPVLVNQTTLTAVDQFTKATLTSTKDQVNIRFSTDPAFKEGDAVVTR